MKKNGKQSVLAALILKNSLVLSVGSINVDQRVGENLLVEDKNKMSTHKIHEEVSFCEQVESNSLSSTIDGTGRK